MKKKVFLKKEKKTIYLLEDQDVNIHLLKNLLIQEGFDIVEFDQTNDFLDQFSPEHSSTTQKQLTRDHIHLIEKNIRKYALEEYFKHLRITINWLVSILNKFQIGFVIYDHEKYMAYNHIIQESFQYTNTDFEQSNVIDNLLETNKIPFYKMVEQSMNRENAEFSTTIFVQRKDGELVKMSLLGYRINIEGQSFICSYTMSEKEHNLGDKNEWATNKMIINELNQTFRNLVRIQNLSADMTESDSREKIIEQLKLEEIAPDYSTFNLSSREYEVLKLIYKGYTNQQIAENLYISKRTAEFHRSNLLSKTNSRNTADLIRFAIKNKLIL